MRVLDLFRFDELYAMVRVKREWSDMTLSIPKSEEDLTFCFGILRDVSRSFAAVINKLSSPDMKNAICIFYLVLRALDTVEDDMDIPVALKQAELPRFHERLNDLTWCLDNVGKGQEKVLLQQFYRVSREYQKLSESAREVIADICHRMAEGMLHFLTNKVVTKADYDQYCHYVAGLVGHGLTRLFASSGEEDPSLADDLTNANHMGLFLQKTNIIRDYFEDVVEVPPRIFWPREIWGNFTNDICSFRTDPRSLPARECINAMVGDALQHLPYVVEYLSSIREPSHFLFCAVPQVMAISTLALVYNNPLVFTEKVKIRKGLACKLMLRCDSLPRTLQVLKHFSEQMERQLVEDDPSYDVCLSRLRAAKEKIATQLQNEKEPQSYARWLITSYPALGGQFLFNLIDGLSGYVVRKQ